MNPRRCLPWLFCTAAVSLSPAAEMIAYLNYPHCIRLHNAIVSVVLCPDAGGRVLEYSREGLNALYLDEAESSWKVGAPPEFTMSAGRFDVGPGLLAPPRPELWAGAWQGEITGEYSARLHSQPSRALGIVLEREFSLDADSSRLVCTQTMKNVSDGAVEWCFWSRTYARGPGIVYVPIALTGQLPRGYILYEPDDRVGLRPNEPNVRIDDNLLTMLGPPSYPKIGVSSEAGWFAYHEPQGLLFVKRFSIARDRVYNEFGGVPVAIWYPANKPMVELEVMGPRERLLPGESATFTEEWRLDLMPFPDDSKPIDSTVLRQRVETLR